MIPGRSVASIALPLGCWLAISASSVAAAAIVATTLLV